MSLVSAPVEEHSEAVVSATVCEFRGRRQQYSTSQNTRSGSVCRDGDLDTNAEVPSVKNDILAGDTHVHVNTAPAPAPSDCTVTIQSREKALLTSAAAAQAQPQLAPYELSFWCDAGLKDPKSKWPFARAPLGLAGVCVVHRRWDVRLPELDDVPAWGVDGYTVTGVLDMWTAQAHGVVQALGLAVQHCERVSGVVIANRGYRPSRERCFAPMPTVVNVFASDACVLRALGGVSGAEQPLGGEAPKRGAEGLVKKLGMYGVGANFHWTPARSGDIWNDWAQEGAQLALHPRFRRPCEYSKAVHRVIRNVCKDSSGPFASLPAFIRVETREQERGPNFEDMTGREWKDFKRRENLKGSVIFGKRVLFKCSP